MSGALDRIAYNVAETWLLQRGFTPSADWDPADPQCIQDYGPYRMYTIQAEVRADYVGTIDKASLIADFEDYLEKVNKALRMIQFQLYNVEVYSGLCNRGTSIYVSLVHTA